MKHYYTIHLQRGAALSLRWPWNRGRFRSVSCLSRKLLIY